MSDKKKNLIHRSKTRKGEHSVSALQKGLWQFQRVSEKRARSHTVFRQNEPPPLHRGQQGRRECGACPQFGRWRQLQNCRRLHSSHYRRSTEVGIRTPNQVLSLDGVCAFWSGFYDSLIYMLKYFFFNDFGDSLLFFFLIRNRLFEIFIKLYNISINNSRNSKILNKLKHLLNDSSRCSNVCFKLAWHYLEIHSICIFIL